MKYIHLLQGGPQQWSANVDVRIITVRPTGGLGPDLANTHKINSKTH